MRKKGRRGEVNARSKQMLKMGCRQKEVGRWIGDKERRQTADTAWGREEEGKQGKTEDLRFLHHHFEPLTC